MTVGFPANYLSQERPKLRGGTRGRSLLPAWPFAKLPDLLGGTVTDEEEFAARSQLKWTREGDAWTLLYRRQRTGRVVPDTSHTGMWRSVKFSGLSDMVN